MFASPNAKLHRVLDWDTWRWWSCVRMEMIPANHVTVKQSRSLPKWRWLTAFGEKGSKGKLRRNSSCAEKRIHQNWLKPGLRSLRFLSGVGFLTTLAAGVGFFCPTPAVQLDHSSHHTPKLGIPVETGQFLLKLLLKQIFFAVHHDFNWF